MRRLPRRWSRRNARPSHQSSERKLHADLIGYSNDRNHADLFVTPNFRHSRLRVIAAQETREVPVANRDATPGEQMAVRIDELRRSCLSALSIGLSCAVFWLAFSPRLPGYASLHKWYSGCICVFLVVLMAMMVLAFRGKSETHAWPIIIGAVLGWAASSLAYVIYFGVFGDLFSTARSPSVISVIAAALLLPPLATLSWLFGSLSGAFFVLLRYLLLRTGQADAPDTLNVASH